MILIDNTDNPMVRMVSLEDGTPLGVIIDGEGGLRAYPIKGKGYKPFPTDTAGAFWLLEQHRNL